MEKAAKRSGTPEGFRESLKKATTEMLVLFLYLTIHRLQDFGYVEEQGKVVSEDNRVRLYFAITPKGEKYLDDLIREYRRYTGAVDQILGLTERGNGV